MMDSARRHSRPGLWAVGKRGGVGEGAGHVGAAAAPPERREARENRSREGIARGGKSRRCVGLGAEAEKFWEEAPSHIHSFTHTHQKQQT